MVGLERVVSRYCCELSVSNRNLTEEWIIILRVYGHLLVTLKLIDEHLGKCRLTMPLSLTCAVDAGVEQL